MPPDQSVTGEVVPEVDLLDRRLGYVLMIVNIAGALLALGCTILVMDKLSGGQLERDFGQWREAYKQRQAQRAEYAQSLRRVEYETWRALREANDV